MATSASTLDVMPQSPRARAVAALRDDILLGRIRPGERLPAEETLASQLSVSRGTLRLALAGLEEEGLVRRRRNQGCIVSPSASSSGLMASTVVLLSNVPEADTPPGHVHGSKLHAINSGVFAAVTSAGLSFMSIYGEPYGEDVANRLLADRPYAILINGLAWERSSQAQRFVARLVDAGLPVVIQTGDPIFAMADRIASDHEGGAYAVTRWLAAQGRQRILRFWPGADDWFIKAHDRGYERAIAEAQLASLPPLIIPGIIERQPGDRANFELRTRQIVGFLMEHLAGSNPVDAIMVVNDGYAFLAAAACRLLGKVPNRDVLIAGYDNMWHDMPERQWEPAAPVVSVDKQNQRIGEELVRLMQDRLSGTLPPERQYRMVPQKLVPNV